MNGKFFELKKEKQDRMINGALKIFAVNGYRHASTDDIVKEAGISKGLLFHYFGNKLGVYQFVYDYSVRYMALELSTYVSARERNLFELVKQIQGARLNAMRGYPYMQEFLNRSELEDSDEVRECISGKKEILENAYQEIHQRMDFASLPQDVDGEKVYRLMNYVADGIIREAFAKKAFQADTVLQEIVEYVEMVKWMSV